MRNFLIIFLLCAGFAACNKPKDIPDEKLEAIVHDLFIANAYGGLDGRNLGMDTMDIYAPIFKEYGYTPNDLMHTIDNLSKRKSVRFTDILDNVIARIESESRGYDSLVRFRDSIDQSIIDRYKKVVYRNDTTRKATRFADLADLKLTIPIQKGSYTVDYVYFLDSTDQNVYMQYHQSAADSAGKEYNHLYRGYNVRGKNTRESVKASLTRDDLKELKIEFGRVTHKEPRNTYLVIDSVLVTFYPTKEAAKDSLLRDILKPGNLTPHNTIPDAGKRKKDFVTLPADTAGISAKGNSVAGK